MHYPGWLWNSFPRNFKLCGIITTFLGDRMLEKHLRDVFISFIRCLDVTQDQSKTPLKWIPSLTTINCKSHLIKIWLATSFRLENFNMHRHFNCKNRLDKNQIDYTSLIFVGLIDPVKQWVNSQLVSPFTRLVAHHSSFKGLLHGS